MSGKRNPHQLLMRNAFKLELITFSFVGVKGKSKLNIFLTAFLVTINLPPSDAETIVECLCKIKKSASDLKIISFHSNHFPIVPSTFFCLQLDEQTATTLKMFNHRVCWGLESLLNWGWNRIILALFAPVNVIERCFRYSRCVGAEWENGNIVTVSDGSRVMRQEWKKSRDWRVIIRVGWDFIRFWFDGAIMAKFLWRVKITEKFSMESNVHVLLSLEVFIQTSTIFKPIPDGTIWNFINWNINFEKRHSLILLNIWGKRWKTFVT